MTHMPLQFQFQAPGRPAFSCALQCQRCTAVSANGQQCKKTACIGVPKCWVHLLRDSSLRIKHTTLPGAARSEKGLFALQRGARAGDVVFAAGQLITPYGGERVRGAALQRRYGDYTAKYGIQLAGNAYENGACVRGVGAIANHAPGRRANAEFVNDNGKSKLYATRDITNGQEIFVDYGDQYLMDEPGVKSVTRRTRGPSRVVRRSSRLAAR